MEKSIVRRTRRPSWMTPFGGEGWGDVFFDRLWPEWRRDMGEELSEWSPAISFFEKDGKYHITAEVPGIKKDDLSVTVSNGYVNISGKKESSKEEKDANYYMRETSYGSFSRSFKLPGDVHEDKIDASYKDGVLTLTLPIKEESKTKKIQVH